MTRAAAFLEASADALGGPIFARELRIASRKRRTYWLRALYVLGLAVVLSVVLEGVHESLNPAFAAAKAAIVARAIASAVTWGNFIVAQIVAVSLLSSAMSDEARRQTLGVLMTTPMSAGRFVAGMLLGRLVQPLFLVALSFPCLAVLRIFGGIPWELVAAGVAITITTTLFAGALALCVSVMSRRPATVSGAAGGVMILFHIVPPVAFASWLAVGVLPPGPAVAFLFLSPAAALSLVFDGSVPGAGIPLLVCPLHCLVMLGLTALCVALAAANFRENAMRLAFSPPRKKEDFPGTSPEAPQVRPVEGNALVWKDTMTRHRLTGKIVPGGLLVVSLMAYAILPGTGPTGPGEVVISVLVIGSVLALLGLSREAGECIVREKEARTWPSVLTLPLTDRQIIRSKLLAVVRRSAFSWCALLLAVAAVLAPSFLRGDLDALEGAALFCVIALRIASISFFGMALGLSLSASCATSRAARLWTSLLLLLVMAAEEALAGTLFSAIWRPFHGDGMYYIFKYGLLGLAPMFVEISLGLLFLRRAARRVRGVPE